jgi:hypothetical protein
MANALPPLNSTMQGEIYLDARSAAIISEHHISPRAGAKSKKNIRSIYASSRSFFAKDTFQRIAHSLDPIPHGQTPRKKCQKEILKSHRIDDVLVDFQLVTGQVYPVGQFEF